METATENWRTVKEAAKRIESLRLLHYLIVIILDMSSFMELLTSCYSPYTLKISHFIESLTSCIFMIAEKRHSRRLRLMDCLGFLFSVARL